jgi:hypothetical protein
MEPQVRCEHRDQEEALSEMEALRETQQEAMAPVVAVVVGAVTMF